MFLPDQYKQGFLSRNKIVRPISEGTTFNEGESAKDYQGKR